MKIIQIYSFVLGISSFIIPNICSISKYHLEKIGHDEFCSLENIVTENNNEVFASWLNPNNSIKVNHWSSIIQQNPYLHRSNINFCVVSDDSDPDIRVGGGLYANSDYYQPQYLKEDGIGIFKYYHFSQIKNLHANKLDLTPDFTSNHGSISKSNTKLFFTNLLNNLLNDWYWKTFKRELSNSNIPNFYNQLSLVNQDWDFWVKNCNDLMQLEFGVEYNEIHEIHVPINKWIPIFIGAVVSAVLTIITRGKGGAAMSFISSFITSAIIDFFMPSLYTTRYEYIHQFHRFISKPLTMRFWNYLFTTLFGTPIHPKGVLLNFVRKYHELPSELHLDNFDFYLPLDSFMVGYDQLDFHNASLQLSLHTTAMRAGVDLLKLKDEIINSDDIWWGKRFGFSLDMNLGEYADDNSDLVDQLLSYDIHSRFRSIIPEDLDQYFSLSHTKLTEDVIVPATLYFNQSNQYPEVGISFARTIYIRGIFL